MAGEGSRVQKKPAWWRRKSAGGSGEGLGVQREAGYREWKEGWNGAAGGSPGLLANELVGCGPRAASDSHCPQSGLICHFCSLICSNNLRRLLLDCAFSHFNICPRAHARTHQVVATPQLEQQQQQHRNSTAQGFRMRGSGWRTCTHANTFIWTLNMSHFLLMKISCCVFSSVSMCTRETWHALSWRRQWVKLFLPDSSATTSRKHLQLWTKVFFLRS